MDAAEQARRWANAKEKLKVAQLCRDHQFYGESVTRSYYACYQAIWAAVGDPPHGFWRPGGLINEFCRGRWTQPALLPTALAALRSKLDELYRLRTVADYDADPVSVVRHHSVHSVGEALCGLPRWTEPRLGGGGPRRVPPTGPVVPVPFLNRLRTTESWTLKPNPDWMPSKKLYKSLPTIPGGHGEENMEEVLEQVIHQPAATTVGLATAELILAIQKEFPQVRLKPCEPIEGEDIHLNAYFPIRLEERQTVQRRIIEIEQAVQDKYGVYTVVVALPESEA